MLLNQFSALSHWNTNQAGAQISSCSHSSSRRPHCILYPCLDMHEWKKSAYRCTGDTSSAAYHQVHHWWIAHSTALTPPHLETPHATHLKILFLNGSKQQISCTQPTIIQTQKSPVHVPPLSLLYIPFPNHHSPQNCFNGLCMPIFMLCFLVIVKIENTSSKKNSGASFSLFKNDGIYGSKSSCTIRPTFQMFSCLIIPYIAIFNALTISMVTAYSSQALNFPVILGISHDSLSAKHFPKNKTQNARAIYHIPMPHAEHFYTLLYIITIWYRQRHQPLAWTPRRIQLISLKVALLSPWKCDHLPLCTTFIFFSRPSETVLSAMIISKGTNLDVMLMVLSPLRSLSSISWTVL